MARRVYTAQVAITNMTAAQTLMHLTASANQILEILSAHVTNSSNTTNDQELVYFKRITSFDGSEASTALTPSEHDEGDPASTATVKGDVTAGEPTYTANTEMGRMGFPTLAGYHWEPTVEERIVIGPGDKAGLYWSTTPAAGLNVEVNVTYAEMGG